MVNIDQRIVARTAPAAVRTMLAAVLTTTAAFAALADVGAREPVLSVHPPRYTLPSPWRQFDRSHPQHNLDLSLVVGCTRHLRT